MTGGGEWIVLLHHTAALTGPHSLSSIIVLTAAHVMLDCDVNTVLCTRVIQGDVVHLTGVWAGKA